MTQPHIVAIGGTTRASSSTGRALEAALRIAAEHGARTTMLSGEAISFANFDPDAIDNGPAVADFLAIVRDADAVIIGSPGYHGTLSGLVKNALDHVELTSKDDRVYFTDMPVGLIATAAGWQAAVTTLTAMRGIVHALRGWPTPLGVAINSMDGSDAVARAEPQIAMMVGQMLDFLTRR
jgi:FMN reductase